MVGDPDLGEELDSLGSLLAPKKSKSQALEDWGRVRDKEGMCGKRFRKAGAPFCQGPRASSVEPKAEPHSSPIPSPASEVLRDPQRCITDALKITMPVPTGCIPGTWGIS